MTTRICTSTAEDVVVRGKSLPGELMGRVTFTELMFFQALGRMPTPGQAAVLDACLCALMEHGLTPSALAARLTYTGAPEALQGAVAAGLLGVGGTFAGTMEGAAFLLARIVAGEAPSAIAREHRVNRRPIPGFGHPTHKPDDPRAVRLLAIAAEHGVAGAHTEALHALSAAVDAAWGRHLTVNVTGAFAAVLADCGVPGDVMRGFALISRCAGLVGHLHEEKEDPAGTAIWHAAEAAVPYVDD